MIKIKITTFGELGRFTISEPMIIEVASGVVLSEVIDQVKKEILKNFPDFNDFEVLEKSVLADENEILNESYIFDKDIDLAILPPICGG